MNLPNEEDRCYPLVPAGWVGHAVSCLFFRNICIKINTGSDSGSTPGIVIYKIEDNISDENVKLAIKSLIANKKEKDKVGADFLNEGINQLLRLQRIAWLPYEQTGGHCAWTSILCSLLGLIILEKLKTSSELTKEICQEALYEVSRVFRFFREVDATESLICAIDVFAKYNFFGLNFDFYRRIILNCLKFKLDHPLIYLANKYESLKDWCHPKTKMSLLRCVYAADMDSAFISILETNPNLYARDVNDKSFFDDIKEKPIPEYILCRLDPAFLTLLKANRDMSSQ